jgi:hypothetical protein
MSDPHAHPPRPRPLWERRSCAHGQRRRLPGPTNGGQLTPGQLDLIARCVAALISASPPRLALRLGQAAAAIGVSHDHFRKHIAPELRIVREGRVQLVLVSELQRWLDSHASYVIED